jgi:ribosomal protein S19
MSRAKWKNPYIKQLILDKSKKNQTTVLVLDRNYEITPITVGKTFKIYNGKLFIKFLVTDEMIGHKAGEFIPTRIKFTFKKKRKLKKK